MCLDLKIFEDERRGYYNVSYSAIPEEVSIKMRAVAKFEKVHFSQYVLDFIETFGEDDKKSIEEYYDSIVTPRRATRGSAGYDFFSPIDFELQPNETIKIPTGIRCKIDDGYVLELYPRSSHGFKYRLRLDNTVGIIDSDYYNAKNEGHIFVKITNLGDKPLAVNQGDGFCQGIFKEFFITYDDNTTVARTGGLGSTTNQTANGKNMFKRNTRRY